MGNTLGDILAHAMKENETHGEEPKMIKSTNNVHVMLTQSGKSNRIHAIKDLRNATNISLVDAKECIENPYGFYIPLAIYEALIRNQNDPLFMPYAKTRFNAPSRIFC